MIFFKTSCIRFFEVLLMKFLYVSKILVTSFKVDGSTNAVFKKTTALEESLSRIDPNHHPNYNHDYD